MMSACPASNIARVSETESVLLSAASATLRRPLRLDDVVAPLSLLGADSLGIIELTAAVEDAIGVVVPPDLAHESVTIRELAAWIDNSAPPSSTPALRSDPFEQMFADAVLPDDVRPGTGRSGAGLLEARDILLTGATGFLGARLAADLLARSTAKLHCVVRPGAEAPEERLRRRLIENGARPPRFRAGSSTIEADLARPHLGLDAASRERLAASIDRVLHVGASVNWIAPYACAPRRERPGYSGAAAPGVPAGSDSVPLRLESVRLLRGGRATPGGRGVRSASAPSRAFILATRRPKMVAEALVREAGRRGLPDQDLSPRAHLGRQSHRRVQPGRPPVFADPRLRPHGSRTRSRLEARLRAGRYRRRRSILAALQPAGARRRIWLTCARGTGASACCGCGSQDYDVRLVPYQAWLRTAGRRDRDLPGSSAPIASNVSSGTVLRWG